MPTPLGITYVDPDGNDWNLSDLSFADGYICAGIAGIEGFPVSMQVVPLLDGTAIPNYYIPQPGSIALGLLVGRPETNRDEMAYYDLLDRIVRAFYCRRNEAPRGGYLQIQRPDGSVRQIQTFTTAGLDSPEVGISNHTLYSITLQTPDPYWNDLASQSLTYSLGVAPGILPLFPIHLGAGTVLGNTTIVNDGGAQAWPTWTITGPGTPTIKNVSNGRQFALNTPIPAGQVVQITTKPGTQYAVNLTTSTNIWDQLVIGGSISNLWALMSGINQVSIVMAGATSATSVQATWTNRWNRA